MWKIVIAVFNVRRREYITIMESVNMHGFLLIKHGFILFTVAVMSLINVLLIFFAACIQTVHSVFSMIIHVPLP